MKLSRLAGMLVIPLVLAACGPQATPSKPGADTQVSTVAPEQAKVQFERLTKESKGFMAGAMMSVHEVYVMFDPQCPHCGEMWRESHALWPKVKFHWVPVALMGDMSGLQGAALVSAANPLATMEAHERDLAEHKGGMVVNPGAISSDLIGAVNKNTAIFEAFGARGVPFIVGRNAKTGELVTHEGSLPPANLAAMMGWDLDK